MAGGSRGETKHWGELAEQNPKITVGGQDGITIEGPFQTSPVVRERVHGVGIVSRAIAQVKSFDIIARIWELRAKERGLTDRAKEAADVRKAGITADAR